MTATKVDDTAAPLGPESLTWKYFGVYPIMGVVYDGERAGSLVHTTFSLAGLRPVRGRHTNDRRKAA